MIVLEECSVTRNYLDFKTEKEEPYSCKNQVWRWGKCKFHSNYYLKKKNKTEFESEFKKKVEEAKSKDKALKCIGYHFPAIELSKICESELDVIAYFIDAKFHGKIDFSKMNFKKQISFRTSIFYKSVDFIGSIFDEEYDFNDSEFLGNLNSFQFIEFKKKVDFSNNKMNNSRFNHAKFDIVHFNNRIFQGNTSFNHTTFEKESLFKQTKFYNVDFSESVFEENADFNNTKFIEYATFSDMVCSELIKFNWNVSNVSFIDLDIKKIKFGNKITWRKNSENFREKIKLKLDWTRNSDFKIYDERKLEEQIEKRWWKRDKVKVGISWKREKIPDVFISLESIKNIYRDLRDSFDYTLRYETSGEFHVRDLELKRKFKEKQEEYRIITSSKHFLWKHLSIYWIYNMLAQYGQSYHRPIYFAILIITIATGYFVLNGIELAEKEQIEYSIKDIILESFTRSVAAIIPFDILDKGIEYSDKVLRVILLPVSATFFISLKRRMERKFRH